MLAALFFLTPSSVQAIEDLKITRQGDEILLPPLLREYDGGILNVTADHQKKRSVKAGEWLEFGDALSTPKRMSFYVQFNEGMQWVGGGEFEGKIASGVWDPKKPAYEMTMNQGWMRVWAKPSSLTGPLKIKTPKATITANDAVFWLYAAPSRTEVYLYSGTVLVGKQQYTGSVKFMEWSGNPAGLTKTSESWDPVSLEERIAQLYPGFIKLSQKANDEWVDGDSSDFYAKLRAQGFKDRRYEPRSLKK